MEDICIPDSICWHRYFGSMVIAGLFPRTLLYVY